MAGRTQVHFSSSVFPPLQETTFPRTFWNMCHISSHADIRLALHCMIGQFSYFYASATVSVPPAGLSNLLFFLRPVMEFMAQCPSISTLECFAQQGGGWFAFQTAHSASRSIGKKVVKGNTLEASHELREDRGRGPGGSGQRGRRRREREASVVLSRGPGAELLCHRAGS